MDADKVPIAERPLEHQLKHQRSTSTPHRAGYSADCVGMMWRFLADPPIHELHVFADHVVCSREQVRIPFAIESAFAQARQLHLSSVLMDFTFKTNEAGLVLGAVGPVGLDTTGAMPSMRFSG